MPHIVTTPPAGDIEPARVPSYALVIIGKTQAMVDSEIILIIHGMTYGTSVMIKEITLDILARETVITDMMSDEIKFMIAHNGIFPRIAHVPMERLIETARKAAVEDSNGA